MGQSVLVIEDDFNIRDNICHYLKNDGYKVFPACSGEEALSLLKNTAPNVVLLDLGLPDTDGLSLLNRIHNDIDIPTIVISGKGDAIDKIVGLEMGADDYISKPIHLRELSARIKSVLRRMKPDNTHALQTKEDKTGDMDVLEFDRWRLDPKKYEVTAPDNKNVYLTTGEFILLHTLVRRANRVLTRDQLFELTRHHDYDSFDRAIDTQIGRLRKKLGDNPAAPKMIKTVRGIGYMFIGKVKKTG